MTKSFSSAFPLTILAVLALLLMVPSVSAQEQTVGLFQYDSLAAFNGYTLFAPKGGYTTYLIDMYGREINSWQSDYNPGVSVYLLENGHLLHTATLNETGSNGGGLEEFDWDGNLVWYFEYNSDDYISHHDVEPLPNGNVLMIAREYMNMSEVVANGRDSAAMTDTFIIVEHIIEVEPTPPVGGNIVWEWHAKDHLVQDHDAGALNYGVVGDHSELIDFNFTKNGGSNWLHANGIDYNPELDQIVLSCRRVDEIWVIDHSTTTAEAAGHTGGDRGMGGDLLYRWGNPQTYRAGTAEDIQLIGQHDARWIKPGYPGAGNMTVFNNGRGRAGGNYSTVEEIVTPVDPGGNYPRPAPGVPFGPTDPIWIYGEDTAATFMATSRSGAQRLQNGNTLICNAPAGHIFEVTPDKEIVWDYINPANVDGGVVQGVPPTGNSVFRGHRYAPDYPGLVGRDLTPGDVLELSCCAGLSMGNVDCEGIVDIGDVTIMIQKLFITLGAFCCEDEADLDQSGLIDVGDLTVMISTLFITVSTFEPCP